MHASGSFTKAGGILRVEGTKEVDGITKTEKPRHRTLGNWVSEFLGRCFWLFREETVNLTMFSHSTNFIVEMASPLR